jgi:cytochrome c oxidase subunit 4
VTQEHPGRDLEGEEGFEGLSKEEIRHHVRNYIAVFVALGVLTVLTVYVSYLRLPLLAALVTALLVASVKGSLVAGFFMHLTGEKRIIFAVLLVTVLFFLVLLILPGIAHLF